MTSLQAQAFNLTLKNIYIYVTLNVQSHQRQKKEQKRWAILFFLGKKKKERKKKWQCTQFASFVGDVTGPQFTAGQTENRMISRVWWQWSLAGSWRADKLLSQTMRRYYEQVSALTVISLKAERCMIILVHSDSLLAAPHSAIVLSSTAFPAPRIQPPEMYSSHSASAVAAVSWRGSGRETFSILKHSY